MQKILSIGLYQFEEMDEGDDDDDDRDITYLRYLDALGENYKEYEKYVEENENLEIFEGFLKLNNKLRLCDPFVVSITDQIEETLDEEQCINYKKINHRMKTVEQIL